MRYSLGIFEKMVLVLGLKVHNRSDCERDVMQYGIYIANYALNGDPRSFVKLAKETENCNWDGFYFWDHINPEQLIKKRKQLSSD